MRFFERMLSFQSALFSFPFIGVDVSDASIHIVHAEHSASSQPTIRYASMRAIPSGIVELGVIKNEKDLAVILKASCSAVHSLRSIHSVVASLPEEKAFIKLLQIPRINEESDVRSAIRFEAESAIPLSPSDMYFDYEDITPENIQTDHRDIVVVAYPKTLVDSYVRTFHDAGLRLLALELESQSIIRALYDPASRAPFLFIDIGRTKSGFGVFSGESVLFTSTLPLGGQDFEEAIRKNLSVPDDEALRMKKDIGLSDPIQDGSVSSALHPLIAALIDEIGKHLAFFETHPYHSHTVSSPKISHILLCGGDAYLTGLAETLQQRVGIPVRLGNPLARFSHPVPASLLSEHDALLFTTALGLAARPQH